MLQTKDLMPHCTNTAKMGLFCLLKDKNPDFYQNIINIMMITNGGEKVLWLNLYVIL